jgi:lysine 2,3-aminomutase
MITLERLAESWPVHVEVLREVSREFPFRMSRHFFDLIDHPGDPIWRQVVPEDSEMDRSGFEDPLAEESLSPVPNLVHRYPNRVLWLVSQECALHCRFCTRRRRWAKPLPSTEENLQSGLDYIRQNRAIEDVLLSGGDPLMLSTARLRWIVEALRGIPHVGIIRIGTRVPSALPGRITPELAAMLSRYHPIYMNIHFNHPREITPESRAACGLLANAGIPLGSQTVLLRGVNDRAEILGELFQKLLSMRVRPYYLLQMDLTQGTTHFRTPLSTGVKILQALRNRISGLAVPHFVVDLPGGQGKIPLVPEYVQSITRESLTIRDYRGRMCRYPLLAGEAEDPWLRQFGRSTDD